MEGKFSFLGTVKRVATCRHEAAVAEGGPRNAGVEPERTVFLLTRHCSRRWFRVGERGSRQILNSFMAALEIIMHAYVARIGKEEN